MATWGPYDSTTSGGYARNLVASDYATCRSATTGFAAVNGSLYTGQRLSGTDYTIWDGFLEFDTSSIPDGASIVSATLSMCPSNVSYLGTNFTINAYTGTSWGGGSLTTADYQGSTEWGSLVLAASKSTSGMSAGTRYNFTSELNFLTAINKTGYTRLILISSRTISGTAPTGNEYIYLYDGGDSGYEPQLTVVYASTPAVSTTTATSITANTATSGGDITDWGESACTRGIVWSTSSSLTKTYYPGGGIYTNSGTQSSNGSYVSYMTGMQGSTLYYYRAWATNSVDTGHGTVRNLTTLQDSVKPPPMTASAAFITPTVTAVAEGHVLAPTATASNAGSVPPTYIGASNKTELQKKIESGGTYYSLTSWQYGIDQNYADYDVTPEVTYYYRTAIYANKVFSCYSNEDSVYFYSPDVTVVADPGTATGQMEIIAQSIHLYHEYISAWAYMREPNISILPQIVYNTMDASSASFERPTVESIVYDADASWIYATTEVSGKDENEFVVDKMAGTEDGDYMLVTFVIDGASYILTAPDGWIEEYNIVNSYNRVYVYSKIADSEPSSWTWTAFSYVDWVGLAVGMRGVRGQAPQLISQYSVDTNICPDVTTDMPHFSILRMQTCYEEGPVAYGSNAGYRYLAKLDSEIGYRHIFLEDSDQTSAGVTGSLTLLPDDVYDNRVNFTFAVAGMDSKVSLAAQPMTASAECAGAWAPYNYVKMTSPMSAAATGVGPAWAINVEAQPAQAIEAYVRAPYVSTQTEIFVPRMRALGHFLGLPDPADDIDGFIVYVYSSNTNDQYTFGTDPNLESQIVVNKDNRYLTIHGVPADRYYTFGVQAYRIVDPDVNEDGIIYATNIVQPGLAGENPYQPSTSVEFAGSLTGTITDSATFIDIDASDIKSGSLAGADAVQPDSEDSGTGIIVNSTTRNITTIDLTGIDIRSSSSTSKVHMDSSGLRAYISGTQKVDINAAGYGVFGSGTNKTYIGVTTYPLFHGSIASPTTGPTGGELSAAKFYLTDAGDAVFKGTMTAGTINTSTINSATLTAGSLEIASTGSIYTTGKSTYASTTAGIWMGYDSGSYKVNVGSSSAYMKWTGSALEVSGTITCNSLSSIDYLQVGGTKPPASADQTSGALNSGVTISSNGITISGGGSIKGGQTGYCTGTGFFLGYSSGYKFSIGSGTSSGMWWNGSSLTVKGDITGSSFTSTSGVCTFANAVHINSSTGTAAYLYMNNNSYLRCPDSTSIAMAALSGTAMVSGSGGYLNITPADGTVLQNNTGTDTYLTLVDGYCRLASGNGFLIETAGNDPTITAIASGTPTSSQPPGSICMSGGGSLWLRIDASTWSRIYAANATYTTAHP